MTFIHSEISVFGLLFQEIFSAWSAARAHGLAAELIESTAEPGFKPRSRENSGNEAKSRGRTTYMREEGARGANAVRQRNCQQLDRFRETEKQDAGSENSGDSGRDCSDGMPGVENRSEPKRLDRRFKRRAVCLVEEAMVARSWFWCLLAQSTGFELSAARARMGVPGHDSEPNSQNAGSSETNINLARAIVTLTRSGPTRSIKASAGLRGAKTTVIADAEANKPNGRFGLIECIKSPTPKSILDRGWAPITKQGRICRPPMWTGGETPPQLLGEDA